MKPLFSDTSLAAERAYLELIRARGGVTQVTMARAMSAATIERSRRALMRARPDATPQEIDLWFVELNYGKTLRDKLAAHLSAR